MCAFDEGLELVSDGLGEVVEDGIRHEFVVVVGVVQTVLGWGKGEVCLEHGLEEMVDLLGH